MVTVYEDFDEAERDLRAAAETGGPQAMVILASQLAEIRPERAEEAEHWFRRAAEAGDADAMRQLGAFLAGRPGREDEAETWLRRAIEAGSSAACLDLADLCEDRARFPETEQLRVLAGEAGFAQAYHAMATMLLGIPGREGEAEAWFRRAAAAGFEQAVHDLGVMLLGVAGRGEEGRALLREYRGDDYSDADYG